MRHRLPFLFRPMVLSHADYPQTRLGRLIRAPGSFHISFTKMAPCRFPRCRSFLIAIMRRAGINGGFARGCWDLLMGHLRSGPGWRWVRGRETNDPRHRKLAIAKE